MQPWIFWNIIKGLIILSNREQYEVNPMGKYSRLMQTFVKDFEAILIFKKFISNNSKGYSHRFSRIVLEVRILK